MEFQINSGTDHEHQRQDREQAKFQFNGVHSRVLDDIGDRDNRKVSGSATNARLHAKGLRGMKRKRNTTLPMAFLDTLERKFGRFTFPHLLFLLLAGQGLVYLAMSTNQVSPLQLVLQGRAVLSGEIWRIFTFMVVPMESSLLWFLIGVYVTWLIGSSLEREWGEFRFGVFVGLGWGATVLSSLFLPQEVMGNMFILGMLTLAFARLFPHVEFLLFFVIPVKVRYIGWVMWGFYLLALIGGDLAVRAQVLASIIPYGVFFGRDMVTGMHSRRRRATFRRAAAPEPGEAFHVCDACGRTDRTDPDLDFRYKDGNCVCEICLNEGNTP